MSYVSEPVKEDEEAPPSKKPGSSVFGNLPTVEISAKKLKPLTPLKRACVVAKALYSSEASGFLKGAIVHRLLDYAFGASTKKSPVTRVWSDTLHGLVQCFEFDSVVNGMIRVVQEDPVQDNFDKYRIEDLTHMEFRKRFLPETSKADHVTWQDTDGPCGNSISMSDVIHFLFNADQEIATKHSFESLHREEFEHGGRKCYFTVFKLNNRVYGLSSRALADSYYSSKMYRLYAENHCDYNDSRVLLEHLAEIAKENFIKVVNPEKNMLEMCDRNIAIIPRQVTYDTVRNLPVDQIKHSVEYYLEHRKRQVIAVIGDPGLGKTKAVYNIVNAFPSVPVFVVSASVLGQWADVAAVRSIFSAVSSLKSILILDDFDGFDLGDKDDVTNEFLLQFEGARGFTGVAFLIINDPSRVNHTLMNRAGRVDQVHEMKYLMDPEHVREAIQVNYPGEDLSGCESVFEFMVKNKLDTARIVGAAEYAVAHNNGIDPSTLQNGVDMQLLFRENAGKVSVKGRLKTSSKMTASEQALHKTVKQIKPQASPRFKRSRSML